MSADGKKEPFILWLLERIANTFVANSEDKELARRAHEFLTRQDLVLVSRSFLGSTPCPNASCSGGMIINSGPDHVHEPCMWCEEKDRYLKGELPMRPEGG